MNKKKPYLLILISSVSIPLAVYFIWNAITGSPYYDTEIPFSIENKTGQAISININIFDQFENEKIVLNQTQTELMPSERRYFLHPEYTRVKKQYIYIEIRDDEETIYTFSAKLRGKSSFFGIQDEPLRIIDITEH